MKLFINSLSSNVTPTDYKVVLMGDKTGSGDATVSPLVNDVIMAEPHDLIMGIGDYDGVDETVTMDILLEGLSGEMYSSPGNHDDWDVGDRPRFDSWFDGGGYRVVSKPNVDFFIYDYYLNSAENGWWSLPEADLISLAERQGNTQGLWLINAMQNSTAKFKILVLHNPPYVSPSNFHIPGAIIAAQYMRWDWASYGIDLILAGHFHYYERLRVNTGSGNVDAIVLGHAGSYSTPGWTSVDPNSQYIVNELVDPDFASAMLTIMTVTDNSLTVKLSAIDSSYNVIRDKDMLEIIK